MSQKYFINIILGILVPIIIGELIYIFIWKPSSNKTTISNSILISPQVTPTSDSRQAIPQENLEGLNNLGIFKKGVLQSADLSVIVKGKIISKKDIEKKYDDGTVIMFKEIIIEGENGDKNTFTFSDEYSKLSIYNGDSSRNDKIQVDNLDINNILEVSINSNLVGEYDERIIVERY